VQPEKQDKMERVPEIDVKITEIEEIVILIEILIWFQADLSWFMWILALSMEPT